MVRSRSFIATPPGSTIKEQLNDRGMSQKEFAARMDMSEKHISKPINGDVHLTPETDVRLERKCIEVRLKSTIYCISFDLKILSCT